MLFASLFSQASLDWAFVCQKQLVTSHDWSIWINSIAIASVAIIPYYSHLRQGMPRVSKKTPNFAQRTPCMARQLPSCGQTSCARRSSAWSSWSDAKRRGRRCRRPWGAIWWELGTCGKLELIDAQMYMRLKFSKYFCICFSYHS